ncbi:Phosphoglucomutase-2 [Taphrina deformans PYCC 5710]|uniref:Phosphoglucomutase-2 n=1 Tax=Taphrina deformans (strain PYCC 5710 / ATCC 11124 / CBS 356.35 / IMI 108563 / JCM 9778 / NBRC 8474) TaxID=1097556 RepID=R4X6H4_TAPDE|nr:Phosphoglucomutase-2 [Taphrina deformans PYCC 5710]|eukprot:CCG80695.1 Phosphoglucomutase-2 [Taphrina deformans PYCC 5710]
MDEQLEDACDNYLRTAFTEADKKQIQDLLDTKDYIELRKRMLPRITFGTSGLRSKMEAGYARMNDLTVFQASEGLRDYILSTVPDAKSRGIVVGHDHRFNSQRFAQIVQAVFAPSMKVFVFGTLVHTPLVPFAVKTLGAACGVMITASHNPKQDNGYKVYGENSCAIIPPHDRLISEAIEAAISKNPKPEVDFESSLASLENVYEAMTKAYFGALFQAVGRLNQGTTTPSKPFKFCYTPMHGVGLIYARVAMSSSSQSTGPSEMITVADQAYPDPEFSTVKFPNPEEAGALDLAMQTADEEGISIIVATDPDADRLGVAEKVDGKWRILTGNQIGTLLASHLIQSSQEEPKRAMLSSTVSSKILQAIGEKEGIHWEETLTGFKWLGNRALSLREAGYNVILAYEEALGFLPCDIVYDKDGILSMAVLLNFTRTLYASGRTLSDELTRLYRTYGYFQSSNSYFIVPDPPLLARIMASLRDPRYPDSLNHRPVTRVRDLTRGYDSSTEDHVPSLPTSKSSEMITFWFSPAADEFESATMTIRGSGTEPKLKYYIEARSTSTEKASAAAQAIERDLIQVWFKDFTLQRP